MVCCRFIVVLLLVDASAAEALGFDPEPLQAFEGQPVGAITISGNRITKDYVIRRELVTAVGEPLRVESILEDVQRLDNLGIFSSVRVIPSTGASGIDLELQVTEMPWIVPFPSVSFTEEDGWSIGASIAALNLTGRAIGLSGGAMVGGVNTVHADFNYPWMFGNHNSVSVYFAHLERDDQLNEFRETSNELTPWYGTYLGKHGRARFGISWFQMRSDVDGKTLEPGNVDDFFRIGGAIGLDTRDSWRNPHNGWWTELKLIGPSPLGTSSGNYLTSTIDIRRYQPTFGTQTLMLGALTSWQTGKDGIDVPGYMQYRMGGANSIRGYNIEELGRVLFGKSQMIYTAEYQFLLMPIREFRFFKWPVSLGLQLALFADTGIAWNEDKDFALDRFKTGFGTGIRVLVPGAEMVRFDVGVSSEGDVQFHLAGESKLTAQRRRLR